MKPSWSVSRYHATQVETTTHPAVEEPGIAEEGEEEETGNIVAGVQARNTSVVVVVAAAAEPVWQMVIHKVQIGTSAVQHLVVVALAVDKGSNST